MSPPVSRAVLISSTICFNKSDQLNAIRAFPVAHTRSIISSGGANPTLVHLYIPGGRIACLFIGPSVEFIRAASRLVHLLSFSHTLRASIFPSSLSSCFTFSLISPLSSTATIVMMITTRKTSAQVPCVKVSGARVTCFSVAAPLRGNSTYAALFEGCAPRS